MTPEPGPDDGDEPSDRGFVNTVRRVLRAVHGFHRGYAQTERMKRRER